MVVKEMESKFCRCNSVILIGVMLAISVFVIVILCSMAVQLQMIKADVARIKEQQHYKRNVLLPAACEQTSPVSNILL